MNLSWDSFFLGASNSAMFIVFHYSYLDNNYNYFQE
jgi:hypothetical protein